MLNLFFFLKKKERNICTYMALSTCKDAAALLGHVSPEDLDVSLLQVSWHGKDVSSTAT